MNQSELQGLRERVQRLRTEAEALAGQAAGFPALDRNARRLLACVSMMEMDLGLVFRPPLREPEA
ncbi:MAG: hypothetical protein C4525_05415 [Desulfarculus sp.]|nr:MAG: hypothetical protein C4525_05415 [Desulfarculus sp.]